MTTMGLGAAKRQAINETVRLRMAALLPTGDESVGGVATSAASGAAPGATPTMAGPGTTGPPPGAAPVPQPPGTNDPDGHGAVEDPPGARARPRFGSLASFASAVALDRRAVAGLAILLLFAVGYAVQHFWLARPETVAVPALTAGPAPPGASASPVEAASGTSPPEAAAAAVAGSGTVVVVDIGGRVHVPGLHTLPGGSRVADALLAAGGPLPETDTRSLNLARVLTDGEQLLVGEQAPVSAAAPALGTGSGPAGPATPRPPVSLNRATLEQLDTLPGVGPTLAQRILAYRSSHGSFRSLDQLRQVSGIGTRTYAELRPLLTL
ncbi:competence protein ComEA [Streptomyces sp. 1114.5]|uniref:helix-hairpin-helix domain-containing protein n=1 Tax=Streptomyces sp. 1114.5 TaxID=1938830 RepID=UPI000EAFC88B|nr:helix-hairpin-helix domain-containing protein [Streptomyces sp. 1114.5]RKT18019.1 competence protein ComEA [Streptomyces sp. 1114.5]